MLTRLEVKSPRLPQPARVYWRAVLRRDPRYDARLVFGVCSTCIYCRPGCPAPRPFRSRIEFFATPAEAEAAGFRACRRCAPQAAAALQPAATLARRVRDYLDEHFEDAPPLEELARRFHRSAWHLQRTFKAATGMSPRQYCAMLRVQRFKGLVKQGAPLSAAIYEAGYGSSSRVYEKSARQLGMTPGSYRKGGAGEVIRFAVAACPLGKLLVAATQRGICRISMGDRASKLEEDLRAEFPRAAIRRGDDELRTWLAPLLARLEGRPVRLDLPLDLRATAFQCRVWQALQDIPYGQTRSYSQIAEQMGKPTATRAVARACATNPAAIVVPCHRVVRKDGDPGGYRWGLERKFTLLGLERMRVQGLKGDCDPGLEQKALQRKEGGGHD